MRHNVVKHSVVLAALSLCFARVALAHPIITDVVETGGDNEATGTVTAKWTGVTFVNGAANQPIPGSAAGDSYTVGLFGNGAPSYVDRNHRYTNASGTVLIPDYLLDGEYIMSGNDNRDNGSYLLDVTVSQNVQVYLLIDNRLSDGDGGSPPTFGSASMQWVLDEGWLGVMNGLNRTANMSIPDEVGIDEGADGSINQWFSVYTKSFPAGMFQLRQADNAGRNMYGVVVTEAVDPTNLPPAVVDLVPANGAIFQDPANGLSFRVTTVAPNSVATGDIRLFLNGTEVSSSLVFGGNSTNRTVSYNGLMVNVIYNGQIIASDNEGRSATNDFAFDTFQEANVVVIENEDYNYGVDSFGDPVEGLCLSPGDEPPFVDSGGGFQDNPPPSGFTSTGSQVNGGGVGYLDLTAVSGVDFSDTTATTGPANNSYRTCTPVGVRESADFTRTKYVQANIAAWDLELHQMQAGEWLNYTRTFANTNYLVYLRATSSATQQADLGRVTSNRTQPNQTLVTLGRFLVEAGTGYRYVPLTDAVGNPIVVGLSGVQTLRMTAGSANNNLNPNFILLVPAAAPATVFGPVLASADPAPDAMNVPLNTSINATITNRLTTLNTSSVQLALDGTVVSATVTPTASGATVFYQPPAPFGLGTVHTIRLSYRDNESPANSFTNQWSFTTTTDVSGPSLLSAVPRDQAYKVVLTFSEPLQEASAENTGNYTITNSAGAALMIFSATLENSGSNVTLLTAKQAENTQYTVRANVRDAVNNLAASSASFTSWVLSGGFALREVYQNITTPNLSNLLSHASYPANPTIVSYLTSAEAPTSFGDNYGQRVSGLLMPPETGAYLFFLSSDDESMFFLSLDENPANRGLVAQEISWTPAQTWTGDRTGGTRGSPPSNISTNAIVLTAGQKYYFELIHKEGTGGDSLGLNWQLPSQGSAPSNTTPTQITSQYLASYAPAAGASITITQQPMSTVAQQNSFATFSVGVQTTPSNAPVVYQWQVSTDSGATWSDIAGANGPSFTTPRLTLADNNKRYRVQVSTPGASATSLAATLTVNPDTVPPMLRYRADGIHALSQVTLFYSELMEASSAANPNNYSIQGPAGALSILSAMMAPDGTNVVLTTAAQTQGARYVVTVVGQVRDAAGNLLAPNMNGQSMAVFYSGGITEFARIDVGPTSGREAAGWIELPSTPAAAANGMNYAAMQLTSSGGTPFTIAIDNMNTGGGTTGGIDWRDRGDSTASGDLIQMAEDFVKNNGGIIHVTLAGLPAGNYRVTSYHVDMTPGGANQSDNIRVFVNGVLQEGVRGNADQVVAINNLTDSLIQNSAATFEFTADGSNPVSIHFDGTVNISRTDTEAPLNGLVLESSAGSVPNPTITLTAPADGQLFAEGGNITISANAMPTHPDDPITMVEFFANGEKIGEDTAAPYSFTWSGVMRGNYEIYAVVTDKLGSRVESDRVNITVDSTPPVLEYAWASVNLDSNGTVLVTLHFDEPLSAASAINPSNYDIVEAGPTITNVMAGRIPSEVILAVSGLASNTFYTVRASGVADTNGNAAVETTAEFALPFVQINFQLASAPVPSGYLADGGLEFGDRGNGFSYGWSTNSTDDTRDRNNTNAFDQRYDTLNHFQRAGDMHVWELQLPSGVYDIFVSAGDISNADQVNTLDIEGVVAVDLDGEVGNIDEYYVQVEVTDGRLTIQPAAEASNAKIMFLQVIPGPGLGSLTIERVGGNVRVTWNGPGRLQQSPTVLGPWSDVPGNPSSPYETPASGSMMFYRLIDP